MSRRFYVAVNAYRSSTDSGFANTWRVYRCHSAAQQRKILTLGLPVRDAEYIDNDGRRSPVVSTMGVRAVTASERRQAQRDERWDRYAVQTIDTYAYDQDNWSQAKFEETGVGAL